MRFMGFVKMEEGKGAPPQALIDAMGALMEESIANGTLLDGGGLFGTEDSVNFVVRDGQLTTVDGPYAEAKEVVGGYAVMEYRSKEDAVENARRTAQLHIDHWPGWEGTVELRQIAEEPPPAS
jgi:hypothetical protein